MKYIYLNDLNFVLRKKKNILILYFSVVLLYFVINVITSNNISVDLIYDSLGLKCEFKTSGWMKILIFCFSQTIYIYIALQIFYKDLKFGYDIIYTRIRPIKWFSYKLISIYSITTTLLCSIYILFNILLVLQGDLLNLSLYTFSTNLVYILCIQTLVLLFVFISKILMIFIPFLIFIYLFVIMNIPTNILSLNLYMILIILLVVNYIVLIFYKKFYMSVNENS